jgi:hypothetical protein
VLVVLFVVTVSTLHFWFQTGNALQCINTANASNETVTYSDSLLFLILASSRHST